MTGPDNSELPFFAYGFFRPGEISFLGIKDFVADAKPFMVPGEIKHRDGLNLFVKNDNKTVDGYLINFHKDRGADAYRFINAMEPDNLFYWKTDEFNGTTYNILYGKKPNKGSETSAEFEFDSVWKDPFFTLALVTLEEFKIEEYTNDRDLRDKAMFKLQMKYMLLWTIIERFIFLRYSLGGTIADGNKKFAENLLFKEGLEKFIPNGSVKRPLFKSDVPDKQIDFSIDDAKKAIQYYYQVRCNVTHRGKGLVQDLDLLKNCYSELYNIINHVLKETYNECEQIEQQYKNNM
jgi:hypothetical protein